MGEQSSWVAALATSAVPGMKMGRTFTARVAHGSSLRLLIPASRWCSLCSNCNKQMDVWTMQCWFTMGRLNPVQWKGCATGSRKVLSFPRVRMCWSSSCRTTLCPTVALMPRMESHRNHQPSRQFDPQPLVSVLSPNVLMNAFCVYSALAP